MKNKIVYKIDEATNTENSYFKDQIFTCTNCNRQIIGRAGYGDSLCSDCHVKKTYINHYAFNNMNRLS